MHAVRLVGPRQLEHGEYPEPPPPGPGEVLIGVGAVGICGSDLHLYETGRIGSTVGAEPFVLGHELMGTVLAAGAGARDGTGRDLPPGTRVAVDPQIPCGTCEWCQAGHPNLCPDHRFLGLYPTDGALRERMLVPARNCFPLPADIGDAAGALLEPLGVALHAADLARLRIGRSCAVLGCGAIGLLLVRLARLAGANPLVAVDPRPWRAETARAGGATHLVRAPAEEAVESILHATGGRGCDVVFEAAWAGAAVQAAVDAATPGGRLVLVGIPGDDSFSLVHSAARRKGLTLLFSRRMKHTYPRAIALASGANPRVVLDDLVTHEFPLARAADALAVAARYADGVIKAVVRPNAG